MNAHCESSKTTQQLATQTVQYSPESAKNIMRDPSYLLAECARSAETEFILSRKQQRTLHKLVEMGEFGTHQILIVDQITKYYNRPGVPLFELISSINQGITDALDRFELVNGYCFSSYLVHCIYHYIERMLLSKNSLSGSFQARRAPALSFDNPAHQRWRI
jgi:DNA-directed RNA polymerase sigma subunit (sigma70/sigma32)